MSVDVTVRRSLATACVGEFARLGSDRRPQAYPVTPLLLEDRPAVAYPYARAAEAREVAGSPAVAMVISDDRMSGGGWQPVAVTGRPRLVEDREGALFASALLTDELRKHPPSRPLIDSPLLRREHWWYLPRLIVVIEEGVAMPVGARPEGLGEVLPLADGPRQLYVDTVGYTDEGGDRVPVTSLAGREPVDGPAVMLGHDFSSDLESWTPWVWRGRLSGSVLVVCLVNVVTVTAPAGLASGDGVSFYPYIVSVVDHNAQYVGREETPARRAEPTAVNRTDKLFMRRTTSGHRATRTHLGRAATEAVGPAAPPAAAGA